MSKLAISAECGRDFEFVYAKLVRNPHELEGRGSSFCRLHSFLFARSLAEHRQSRSDLCCSSASSPSSRLMTPGSESERDCEHDSLAKPINWKLRRRPLATCYAAQTADLLRFHEARRRSRLWLRLPRRLRRSLQPTCETSSHARPPARNVG